jgi:thiol-disulfide isomerase/thioredoxin
MDNDAQIRTPEIIFKKRLDRYLDVYLKNAPPETIIEYVDKVIDKAKPSKENFRYLVNTIAEKYLQSTVMSYDAIYVHLVKRYIETGMCDWMSPSTVDMNVKRADKWDKLLLGKLAPQLIMKDDKGQWHNLHSLPNKYTLLVFWSPTCGHCKTIIPELFKRYAKYQKKCDIGSFAILSEPDDETRPKWREFINNHNLNWLNIDGGEANIDWHDVYDIETTPQIYLLDKDKKIIAKKLNAESFEEVIKILEKIND